MPPFIATVIYAIVILGLFWLDRDREVRASKALWVPVAWVLLAGSRPVTVWFVAKDPNYPPERFLEANPTNEIIFSVLMLAALIVLVNRRTTVIKLLRANGAVLLFFLYCGISVLWSDYPGVAFRHWIRSLGDLVMILVVLTEADLSSAFKKLFTPPAFVFVPISILFIKYFPDLGRDYNEWTFVPTYRGVAINKNALGLACLVFGLASLWCFLAARQVQRGGRRTRQLVAHGAVLFMVMWLFWMSNSMTSLCCFLMAGGLMVITTLSRSARQPAVLHLLVAAVLCMPLIALFSGAGVGMVQSLGRDATLTGRTNIWKVVLSVSGSPLVGSGFESFWLPGRLEPIWAQTMHGLQEAHDGYLEVYLNLGWIGVMLLGVLVVRGYRNVVAAVRRDPSVGGLKLALFLTALAYNLTEAGFKMMSLVWISFLLVTSATPEAVVEKVSPMFGIEQISSAPTEPQLEQASSGLHEEGTTCSSPS
jgi:O-antigen ligase